jgi:cellulose synthase/poly-beta-1,6-N-acetylglucosamine synthase-like glycosyltransferase
MSYKNIEIFITDNSDNKETISQLESLSKKFQINFVHRDGLQGFKAKNLNDVLKRINGKYFIIVDIDQSLKDQAIEKFLYQFELSNNNKLAFIQGRFEIQNASNIIRTSIAILYTFFYDVISIAKSHRKTVLFNGSSACFRTEIIKEVGGFPENCFTEDIAISYVLILNGYQSIYLNETVTTALVPWKLSTLLSSFWRWSHGGTSCLLLYGNQILKSKKISFDTKIELWMNTISFIAISGILIVIYSMLCMYWLEIKILRPELSLNTFVLPLYLIFPIFTSFNHLINCVIGMWESKTLKRILYLIPYSIASLAISIFIILPTYYALLKIKGPNSNQSKWNRSFNIPKTITYLLCNLIVFFASFYHALIRGDLFLVSFATMALILFSTILFLIKDYFINPSKEEKIYFTNYRIKKNFPLE